MVKALQFHPPPEELIEQLINIPEQAMEVDPVIGPTAMEVDATKHTLLCQAFHHCPMFKSSEKTGAWTNVRSILLGYCTYFIVFLKEHYRFCSVCMNTSVLMCMQ